MSDEQKPLDQVVNKKLNEEPESSESIKDEGLEEKSSQREPSSGEKQTENETAKEEPLVEKTEELSHEVQSSLEKDAQSRSAPVVHTGSYDHRRMSDGLVLDLTEPQFPSDFELLVTIERKASAVEVINEGSVSSAPQTPSLTVPTPSPRRLSRQEPRNTEAVTQHGEHPTVITEHKKSAVGVIIGGSVSNAEENTLKNDSTITHSPSTQKQSLPNAPQIPTLTVPTTSRHRRLSREIRVPQEPRNTEVVNQHGEHPTNRYTSEDGGSDGSGFKPGEDHHNVKDIVTTWERRLGVMENEGEVSSVSKESVPKNERFEHKADNKDQCQKDPKPDVKESLVGFPILCKNEIGLTLESVSVGASLDINDLPKDLKTLEEKLVNPASVIQETLRDLLAVEESPVDPASVTQEKQRDSLAVEESAKEGAVGIISSTEQSKKVPAGDEKLISDGKELCTSDKEQHTILEKDLRQSSHLIENSEKASSEDKPPITDSRDAKRDLKIRVCGGKKEAAVCEDVSSSDHGVNYFLCNNKFPICIVLTIGAVVTLGSAFLWNLSI